MAEQVIETGAVVRFRRRQEDATGVVLAIDRVPKRGDMFGQRVDRMPWADRDFAFLTLDCGYCYGSDLL